MKLLRLWFFFLCLLSPAWAEEVAVTLDPTREVVLEVDGGSDLLVRGRIDLPAPGGAAYIMQVTADGQPLGTLVNKGASFRYRDGREYAYGKEGGVWNVFYSPNFIDNDVSTSPYQVTTDPGQAYLYRWRVPGKPGQKVAVRIRHFGTQEGQVIDHPLVLKIFSGDRIAVDALEQELADMTVSTGSLGNGTFRRRGKRSSKNASADEVQVTQVPEHTAVSSTPPTPARTPAAEATIAKAPLSKADTPQASTPAGPPLSAEPPRVEMALAAGKALHLDVPSGLRLVLEARPETAQVAGKPIEMKVSAGPEVLGQESLATDVTQTHRYEWTVPGQPGAMTSVSITHEGIGEQPNLVITLIGKSEQQARADQRLESYNKMLRLLGEQWPGSPTRSQRRSDIWTVESPNPSEATDL